MKPEESIFFRLAKANQMAGRFWKTRLAPFKLTAVQGMVLVFLHEEDGLTATELGKRIRLDSATMTGVLARLEKAGLLQRRKDAEDLRSVRVCLTAAGRRVGRQVAVTLTATHEAFMTPFSPKEAGQLAALLQRLEA